ncbi:hypothetical protein [Erythrobacter sp. R86502]
MQNVKTNFFAAVAALVMTAIVTAPISTDETTGLTALHEAGAPLVLA